MLERLPDGLSASQIHTGEDTIASAVAGVAGDTTRLVASPDDNEKKRAEYESSQLSQWGISYEDFLLYPSQVIGHFKDTAAREYVEWDLYKRTPETAGNFVYYKSGNPDDKYSTFAGFANHPDNNARYTEEVRNFEIEQRVNRALAAGPDDMRPDGPMAADPRG